MLTSLILKRRPWFKGQTAIELLTLLSITILLFSAFYLIFSAKSSELLEKRINIYAKAIAEKTAFELNVALLQGENFSKYFELPQNVFGLNYFISLENTTEGNWIVLSLGQKTFSSFTPAPKIIGNITPGRNFVRNVRGDLYVN
jgi:hypothetical protein